MQEKSREFSILKQRLLRYLDFKGIDKKEVYTNTGISNGIFSQKTGMNEDSIMRFLNYYTDLNKEWLFTGKGNMLISESKSQETKEVEVKYKTAKKGIPLVGTEALAGTGNCAFNIEKKDIISYYVIPEFEDADFIMPVKGNSMQPTYNSGDRVACRILHERSFIQWNRVHALATNQQGILIKRLKKTKKDEIVKVVSDNKDFDPFDVSWNEITGIALVLGGIKIE